MFKLFEDFIQLGIRCAQGGAICVFTYVLAHNLSRGKG